MDKLSHVCINGQYETVKMLIEDGPIRYLHGIVKFNSTLIIGIL
jgi:hypothetical protein